MNKKGGNKMKNIKSIIIVTLLIVIGTSGVLMASTYFYSPQEIQTDESIEESNEKRIKIPGWEMENPEPITLQSFYLEDAYSEKASQIFTNQTKLYTNGEIDFAINYDSNNGFVSGHIIKVSDEIRQFNKSNDKLLEQTSPDYVETSSGKKLNLSEDAIIVEQYDTKESFEAAVSKVFGSTMTIGDLEKL